MSISKLTTCLWFTSPQALHAAEFYTTLFNNRPKLSGPKSSITGSTKYPNAQPSDTDDTCKPSDAGSLLTVSFTLAGTSFVALNGNREGSEMPWKFNEAVSFQIKCETQEEVDYFWDGITGDGGHESFCGWCKDRWGVSWQVVPAELEVLMGDDDGARKERVATKMYTMRKLDLEGLRAAARGE